MSCTPMIKSAEELRAAIALSDVKDVEDLSRGMKAILTYIAQGYKNTLPLVDWLESVQRELCEAIDRLLPMAVDDVGHYGGNPDEDDDIAFARAAIAKVERGVV